MSTDENKIASISEKKFNFFPYLLGVQYFTTSLLFIASLIILDLPLDINLEIPLVEFGFNLIFYGMAFNFFSFVLNIIPLLVVIYQKRKTRTTITFKFKEIDKMMIPSAIIFLLSIIAVIAGFILYL
ncbi:MAG: hypothetical protein ACTSP3_03340 [Candidatus Heimdallarchaeaceae archaeon]